MILFSSSTILEQGIRTRAGDKDPGAPESSPSDKILNGRILYLKGKMLSSKPRGSQGGPWHKEKKKKKISYIFYLYLIFF
jgi:hypothetical protein